MKNDQLYLTNIQECITKIEDYITTNEKDTFLTTPMIQDAVIRNFEIIGEATKRLSSEITLNNPDINWREIAGFRDFLIHNYSKVNLSRVWGVIENDLPKLKAKINQLLSSYN